MPSTSIAARPFDENLCAALGVPDTGGVTRIELVIEPFKVMHVVITRDLMNPGDLIDALDRRGKD